MMIYFTIFEMLNYVLSIYLVEQLFKITLPAISCQPVLLNLYSHRWKDILVILKFM